jgi:hypothetical protein
VSGRGDFGTTAEPENLRSFGLKSGQLSSGAESAIRGDGELGGLDLAWSPRRVHGVVNHHRWGLFDARRPDIECFARDLEARAGRGPQ